MITITDNKPLALYVRINRKVKWQYSEYGGRYRSIKEAIASAVDHMGNVPFEYRIDNLDTDEITTGFVNWEK